MIAHGKRRVDRGKAHRFGDRCNFEVYNILGFGFLESVYLTALTLELAERGHEVVRESCVGVIYKSRRISAQRLDMVVDGRLIVEVKSTEHLPPTAIRAG